MGCSPWPSDIDNDVVEGCRSIHAFLSSNLFPPLRRFYGGGSFSQLKSDITLCGGGSEILGSWSGSFLGVARHYSQSAAHLKHSQLPCFIIKLQVPPASIRGISFRKNWATQSAGRSKLFFLPLPGGVLRVEPLDPREYLRAAAIGYPRSLWRAGKRQYN